MKRVVVGLSGGVDSSVTAHLLQEQGYEVIGIFMRNWHDESVIIDAECPWVEDSTDAQLVAEKLGIPFQVIDFSEVYKKRIVDYMFAEYERGRTPNPDVLCNREIKFDVFLDLAVKLGADYVATGHYCRKKTELIDGKEVHHLLSGKDKNKDQSYFLCQVRQDQLAKVLFPIGELEKSEVRAIAKNLDLVTAEKKDSQGLCFIGKVKLPDFLKQQLAPKKGDILEVSASSAIFNKSTHPSADELELTEASEPFDLSHSETQKVGEHEGAHYYTIGQRKGLAVGGTPEPLFVIGTDTKKNLIYTGQGSDHPGLWRSSLKLESDSLNWIVADSAIQEGEQVRYAVRIRYRQTLQAASLLLKKGSYYLIFDEPQSAITSGQFAAWYDGEELVGSGVIEA